MEDLGFTIDDQLDWVNLLDFTTPEELIFCNEQVPNLSPATYGVGAENLFNPSPDSCTLSVDDIQQFLMNDDDVVVDGDVPVDGFFSDVLVDSPIGGDVDYGSDGKDSVSIPSEEEHKNDGPAADQKKDHGDKGDEADPDDVIAKKRKRQLRNKDAALRSRERKKIYVRDLEMKSRYYEGECRRLGMLLQCCLAENQALRLSLHSDNAFGASMTKQESAVLLLESLLLGSLLWFLGTICQLVLPSQAQPNCEPVLLEIVQNGKPGSLIPRKVVSRFCERSTFQSLLVAKRCKASRTRMKRTLHSLEVSG